ncbi:MAG: GNAT family N-acetyltransferase [Clostridia bacterium]
MDFKEMLYKQLSADFNVSTENLKNDGNIFILRKPNYERRLYKNDDCLLRILAINNKVVFNSTNAFFLERCKELFKDIEGEWISEFATLLKLDVLLRKFNFSIAEGHQYYIPSDIDNPVFNAAELRWFEGDELFRFYGDDDFSEALAFDEMHPDMIAVTAIADEKIIGMAGASRDGKYMWQIGINVLPGYENRGIGTYLVYRLKCEIIKRGLLPFYGTGASHINSQRVAFKAGFIPAFWELYTKIC